MHCKNCNYPLWNLRSRTCPECGSGFAPSDFDFQPGAVRFCCPHCNQEYYGTSPSGHLTPRTFNCVTCQQPVDMDEMVLLPAEGFTDRQTTRATNPWLSKEGSATSRWTTTIGWAMTRPGELIEGTPLEGQRGKAWKFALITQLALMAVTVAIQAAFMALGTMAGGGAGAFTMLFLPLGIIMGIVAFVVMAVIWAGLAHLVLLLTGGGMKPFGRTMEAVLYSSGANVLSAIPCVNYFAWIWWTVSFGIMLRRGHGVAPWRAVIAAAAAPAAFIALIVVLMVVAFGAITAAGAAAAQTQAAQAGATDATRTVTSALLARQRATGWPDHAVRLLDQGLTAGDFAGSLSPTTVRDVTAGGVLVSALEGMAPAERAAAIDEIAAALREDVVAHRVGDFVFTYHGMAERPDPRLWVAIESPPPSQVWSPAEIRVGAATGAVRSFPAEDFPAALDEQNELRTKHGLTPIWHPDRIDDEQPQRP